MSFFVYEYFLILLLSLSITFTVDKARSHYVQKLMIKKSNSCNMYVSLNKIT